MPENNARRRVASRWTRAAIRSAPRWYPAALRSRSHRLTDRALKRRCPPHIPDVRPAIPRRLQQRARAGKTSPSCGIRRASALICLRSAVGGTRGRRTESLVSARRRFHGSISRRLLERSGTATLTCVPAVHANADAASSAIPRPSSVIRTCVPKILNKNHNFDIGYRLQQTTSTEIQPS